MVGVQNDGGMPLGMNSYLQATNYACHHVSRDPSRDKAKGCNPGFAATKIHDCKSTYLRAHCCETDYESDEESPCHEKALLNQICIKSYT